MASSDSAAFVDDGNGGGGANGQDCVSAPNSTRHSTKQSRPSTIDDTLTQDQLLTSTKVQRTASPVSSKRAKTTNKCAVQANSGKVATAPTPTTAAVTTLKPAAASVATLKPTTASVAALKPAAASVAALKPAAAAVGTGKPATAVVAALKPATASVAALKPAAAAVGAGKQGFYETVSGVPSVAEMCDNGNIAKAPSDIVAESFKHNGHACDFNANGMNMRVITHMKTLMQETMTRI
jgi:hypothetical protein